MTDILIAGGGLAGSALAIQLGRMGLSVELFERGDFPKEKPCGEGLMPAGVAALDRLGVDKASEGAPFWGIRYHFAGRIAEGRFPPTNGLPSAGRGCRRRDLDNALLTAARNSPGVIAHTGALVEAPHMENGRVTGLVVSGELRRGRLIIAADGAHSRLRHALHLDAPQRHKRIGMRAHFRLMPGQGQSEWVDIYLGRGFELYVTPLRQGELLVAALAGKDVLSSPVEAQFRRWCHDTPELSARLRGAEQVSELGVTSPLSGRTRPRFLPGLVLLGDAAGFTDPITGGGMTQALLAAELLAQFMAKGLETADRWLAEFDREREALLRDYRRLTGLMLWLADRPALIAKALGAINRSPRLFSHLLGVSGGVRHLWGGTVSPIHPGR
jgi:2-polyprenyl-6-methoxyphenol hydroxylase-like FAD-dependent oxidoreductase